MKCRMIVTSLNIICWFTGLKNKWLWLWTHAT